MNHSFEDIQVKLLAQLHVSDKPPNSCPSISHQPSQPISDPPPTNTSPRAHLQPTHLRGPTSNQHISADPPPTNTSPRAHLQPLLSYATFERLMSHTIKPRRDIKVKCDDTEKHSHVLYVGLRTFGRKNTDEKYNCLIYRILRWVLDDILKKFAKNLKKLYFHGTNY